MTIKLYHLVTKKGDPTTAISPHCVKVEAILNFKGLKFETILLTFLELHEILPKVCKTDGRPTVPVLVDGDTVIQDSWAITEYLENKYPEPSVFQGGKAVHRLVEKFSFSTLHASLFRLYCTNLRDSLDEANARYFVESREAKFGSLDALAARRSEWIPEAEKALGILRDHLKETGKFFCGESIGYADFAIAATFVCFHRMLHDEVKEVLFAGEDENNSTLTDWYERVGVYLK
ncbi:uncharacterized protein VTP21DRAFT_3176 [Calcarisporiella thermophila]|uniref:uncharacterized protein n=1 Tax=Calcarisporiella thermophila TaxID=911321 RepID=UPI00374271A6